MTETTNYNYLSSKIPNSARRSSGSSENSGGIKPTGNNPTGNTPTGSSNVFESLANRINKIGGSMNLNIAERDIAQQVQQGNLTAEQADVLQSAIDKKTLKRNAIWSDIR